MRHAMIFIILLAFVPQDRYETPEMKSLADAERAFAARSVEKGSREAFVENFADDGIAFQPHPVIYRDAVKDRPAPANPKAWTLDWKPVFGDVSESGDLGYTTGPYSLVDNSGKQPTRYGFYFSVWKKDATGWWRVALDIGTRMPEEYEGTREFQQAKSIGKKTGKKESREIGLVQTEENFISLLAAQGLAIAYSENLAVDCRLHIDGRQPITGKAAILPFLEERGAFQMSKPLFTSLSRAGDLGYSYGSYEHLTKGKLKEKGYFGHVWKRDESGRWRLVAEILSPVPQDAP